MKEERREGKEGGGEREGGRGGPGAGDSSSYKKDPLTNHSYSKGCRVRRRMVGGEWGGGGTQGGGWL